MFQICLRLFRDDTRMPGAFDAASDLQQQRLQTGTRIRKRTVEQDCDANHPLCIIPASAHHRTTPPVPPRSKDSIRLEFAQGGAHHVLRDMTLCCQAEHSRHIPAPASGAQLLAKMRGSLIDDRNSRKWFQYAEEFRFESGRDFRLVEKLNAVARV